MTDISLQNIKNSLMKLKFLYSLNINFEGCEFLTHKGVI